MFSFDDNEIAWITENRALGKFVAYASALLIACYAVVDWFIEPGTLAWTLPLRLLGAAPLLAVVVVLDNAKLHKWAPLAIALAGAIVSVVVSIIFLGILHDFKIAVAAQMQVLITIAVFATLRTAVRAILPVLLLSFNAGLWWSGAGWTVFALTNWFLLGAFVTVLVVSEAAYKTFRIRRQLESEHKRAEERSWHQANFDSLTDLPNRALLFDRLSKECTLARRNNTSIALLFADLDGFKLVNDSFGHDAGDLVLKEVARRWLACVREVDTVARLGGDEFAIVLGGLHDTSAIAGMASKLIASLAVDIELPNGGHCRVGASIGICIYPRHATEVDTLISLADAAMYESKARGKNTYTFCIEPPQHLA